MNDLIYRPVGLFLENIRKNSFTLDESISKGYLDKQGNSYRITNYFLYDYLINILDYYSVSHTSKTSYIYIRIGKEYIKFTQHKLKLLIKSFFPIDIYHNLGGTYNIIYFMKLEKMIKLEEFKETIEPCNSEKITFLIDYKRKIIL